jgi:hypothetical protein
LETLYQEAGVCCSLSAAKLNDGDTLLIVLDEKLRQTH